MKEIPFISSTLQREKFALLAIALNLNNLTLVPTKILDIKEIEKNGTFSYYIVAEEGLDEQEWASLIASFVFGARAEYQKKI